jgi:hypothetical protein
MVLLTGCVLAAAIDRGNTQPAKDSSDNPLGLKLRLIAKQDTYVLDLGGKSAEDYRKQIDAIVPDMGKPPPGPKVDLTLEISNPSDKEATIWVGGDDTRLSVELKGPGAASKLLTTRQTADIKISKAIEIPAGKTYSRPVTDLAYPLPRQNSQWYWTTPGEYTLTATWKLGAPKGQKPGPTLTAPPIKLQVVAPKAPAKANDASAGNPLSAPTFLFHHPKLAQGEKPIAAYTIFPVD